MLQPSGCIALPKQTLLTEVKCGLSVSGHSVDALIALMVFFMQLVVPSYSQVSRPVWHSIAVAGTRGAEFCGHALHVVKKAAFAAGLAFLMKGTGQ